MRGSKPAPAPGRDRPNRDRPPTARVELARALGANFGILAERAERADQHRRATGASIRSRRASAPIPVARRRDRRSRAPRPRAPGDRPHRRSCRDTSNAPSSARHTLMSVSLGNSRAILRNSDSGDESGDGRRPGIAHQAEAFDRLQRGEIMRDRLQQRRSVVHPIEAVTALVQQRPFDLAGQLDGRLARRSARACASMMPCRSWRESSAGTCHS